MESGSLRRHWLKSSSVGVLMQGIGLALAFGSSVFMARMLGPEGLGQFAYVNAIVAVLSVFAALGLPTVIARLLSAYVAKEQWSFAKGVLGWAGSTIGVWSLFLALLLATYGWFFQTKVDPMLYLIAAPLVPILALTRLRQRALQALHRPIAAQLPEQLVKHLVFLSIGGMALLLGSQMPKSADGAMLLWAMAAAVAFGVGSVLLARAKVSQLVQADAKWSVGEWRAIALPLFVADALGILFGNTDILMLGMIRSAEEVGVYQVALRLSGLMLVLLGASNWVLAPWFARFHAQEDTARFQSVVTRSGRAIFVATLGMFLVLVLFGKPLLGLFFGEAFQAAYPMMLVLGIGQLINVACGPVVNLLAMANGQKELMMGIGLAVLGNVLLCGLLVPVYGAMGAAVSVALVTIGYNLGLAFLVRQKVGIRATILG